MYLICICITCFHEKTALLMSFEISFLLIHLPEIVDRDSDLLSGVNRETHGHIGIIQKIKAKFNRKMPISAVI